MVALFLTACHPDICPRHCRQTHVACRPFLTQPENSTSTHLTAGQSARFREGMLPQNRGAWK